MRHARSVGAAVVSKKEVRSLYSDGVKVLMPILKYSFVLAVIVGRRSKKWRDCFRSAPDANGVIPDILRIVKK